MGRHRGKNKYSDRRKHPSSLNIKDIPQAKPVLKIAEDIDHIPEATKKVDTPRATEHAPNVKIHAERATPEKQVSRGETLRPAVHGGYSHAFNYYEYTMPAKKGAGK
jgi:hypothetical protein